MVVVSHSSKASGPGKRRAVAEGSEGGIFLMRPGGADGGGDSVASWRILA